MRVLFDQGVPVPLRILLEGHSVRTAAEESWDRLRNGELLTAAEAARFDVFLTTDKNLRHQQNLTGRRIAVIVLSKQQWPDLRKHVSRVIAAVNSAIAGSYVEVNIPQSRGAIRHWLTGLGFEQFAEAFEKNQIDLDIARDFGDQDLRGLGVSVLGHRKLILRAIAALKATARESPADEPPVPSAIAIHEGERRQLTVLFCDMVGFTELANRVDPEVLQQIIRSHEDACAVCITRYDGYVCQRLGDGIVAFFGYPLAHGGEA